MTDAKRDKPVKLDMPFDEALERFLQTDPDDLPDNVKLRTGKKKGPPKRPSSGKKPPDR
ncbi:hypothetical protein KCG44_14245 [Pacificimonas sp. WHA3]|uniref:Uncharacterized protein n=1 Tax=Pacificimonas pallii TaxID=2827236 RepID=A0ABS6SIQ9_9SPHN|nr:hypothetical protein [Pacificimonas pallii]MBV7257943.1 hypothetical protein [Pacificimonas pallii]